MPTYAQNKKHIYNWVSNNREKHNEKNRIYAKKVYTLKKEFEIFRKILLE